MTAATGNASARRSVGAWCRANVHFLVAAGILLVAAAGWNLVIGVLEWAIYKEPVEWPAGVEVDEEFRLISLPAKLASPDSERVYVYDDTRNDAGQIRGDLPITEDEMGILKIGTTIDRKRRPQRRSNWMFARMYFGEQAVQGEVWQLDGYYYTGMLDQVPHVPDRCLVAGGAKLLGTESVTFEIEGVPEPWRRVPFRRALYAVYDRGSGLTRKYAQYYTFSMNGRPEPRWWIVRFELTFPWIQYCYFAKIQFGSRLPVGNTEDADRAAEAFAQCFLPEVLQALPVPEDIP